MQDIGAAPDGSVIMLHGKCWLGWDAVKDKLMGGLVHIIKPIIPSGCAHNPTGIDPTLKQVGTLAMYSIL